MQRKTFTAILLLALTLCLCSCQVIDRTSGGTDGDWPVGVADTSLENILMGNGEFAYYDGFIYFAPPGNIIAEVDLSTMKIAVLDIPCGTWIPNMTTDGEYIYFDATGGGEGRYRISADGKVLERVKGYLDQAGTYRYNEGIDSFYLKGGLNGPLCYENLETHEVTELLDMARSYNLDEDFVYGVSIELKDDYAETYLYYGRRDNFDLQKIQLVSEETGQQICPIYVAIYGNVMYVNEGNTYQVYEVDISAGLSPDEVCTAKPLPVYGLAFYRAGDYIVYERNSFTVELDGEECVYAYNLKTGETEGILDEGIYMMCALADRYVCMHTSDGSMCIFDLEKWEYLAFDLDEEETEPEDTAASEST